MMCRHPVVGIAAPALYHVDRDESCIYMEYLETACTLKDYIDELLAMDKRESLRAVAKLVGMSSAIDQLQFGMRC